jgi:hypothetical protein
MVTAVVYPQIAVHNAELVRSTSWESHHRGVEGSLTMATQTNAAAGQKHFAAQTHTLTSLSTRATGRIGELNGLKLIE